MAFSRALYYPWIEIEDEPWLKNAILYWDKIQTIVPRSIENPYKNKTTNELFSEGLLVPFYVHSDQNDIEELTQDALEYLYSTEGTQILFPEETSDFYRLMYHDKFSRHLIDVITMYPEKLPNEIRYLIEESYSRQGETIAVGKPFANYYMTLLATHLSEKHGIALLTDSAPNSQLANVARLDGYLSLYPVGYDDRRRNARARRTHSKRDRSLAPAMLADLIIEGIQIDPDTPVNKIVAFRNKFQNELGHFRTQVSELTSDISNEQTLDALRQNIYDKYLNEVKPAIDSLRKGLKDNLIRCVTDNLLKISSFSIPTTSISLALLGLSIPYALLAGTGISLTASSVRYNVGKAKLLRENPYTYLLKAQKEFDPNRYQVTVTPL
jgi:hypothetical protein